MRAVYLLPLVALAAAVGCSTQTTPLASTAPRSSTVELKAVTFAELDAEVKKYKGNVVALDMWFLGCGPCRKKFPHFVEMHNKYVDQGLVCMTLDVVDSEPAEQKKALDYLTKNNAFFPNFVLNETALNPPADLADKYPTDVTPLVLLFNRAGKRVKVLRGSAELADAAFEDEVKALLAEKN